MTFGNLHEHVAACFKEHKEQRERIDYLEKLLLQCERHCICTRNTKGFDYGETHKKLGKPKIGARWWTVTDIVKNAEIADTHALAAKGSENGS